MLIALVLLTATVFAERASAALLVVARQFVVIGAVTVAAFALPVAISLSVGSLGDLLAGASGLVLFAVATSRVLPAHWRLLRRLTAPVGARGIRRRASQA